MEPYKLANRFLSLEVFVNGNKVTFVEAIINRNVTRSESLNCNAKV